MSEITEYVATYTRIYVRGLTALASLAVLISHCLFN